jgi:hypothetical protein
MEPAAPVQAQATSTRLLGIVPARLALVAGVGIILLVTSVDVIAWTRPGSFSSTPVGEIGSLVFTLTTLALGALLQSKRPDHALGPLFLAIGLATAISGIAWMVMLLGYLPDGDKRLGALAAWSGAALSVPIWSYLVIALVVRFPSGRAETAFEARVLRLAPFACAIAGIAVALHPGQVPLFPAFDNPVVPTAKLGAPLRAFSELGPLAVVLPMAGAAIGMVRRYRRAASVQRLQLRWFAFGVSVAVVTAIGYLVFGLIPAARNSMLRELSYGVFVGSMSALPISVFQAIATHRLYDIDRIIGRAFAYGLLTAILAGLYAASVRLFNWLFVETTGQTSELVLVLTTLVLATTFTPIKTRLERLVARRFPSTSGAPDPAPAQVPVVLDASQLAALEARLGARIDAAVRDALADRAGAHHERSRRR